MAGLQLAVHYHATVSFQSRMPRQRRFRAQTGGRHYRIHHHRTLAVEGDANPVSALLQAFQLSLQHQMHAHVGQTMLQSTAGFRRHQRRQHAGGVIHDRHRFAGAAEIHRQFAANQAAANDQHPFCIAQLALRRAVFSLAIQRQHQLAARHRRDKRRRAGGQYQFVIAPFAVLALHPLIISVDIADPGMRKQAQIVLPGKLTRRLQGQVVGVLPAADHMAEIRFVVLIHAVGGDQGQRDVRVLLANIFHQLTGREARADDDDAITHFASDASTSNTSLPREHSGQRKLSGTSLHGVPGWTSWFGSPCSGS